MKIRTRTRKLLAANGVAAAAMLATAGTASAGIASYPSSDTFGIPNNTGQAGIPSQTFVPPGRTAVQSLQLTQVKPSFGGGGGGDLSLRFKSPSGTEINLWNTGCSTIPNTSSITINDTAPLSMDAPAFCTALTTSPTTATGRPSQPLAAFNGQSGAGTWTVTVVDVGINGTQGSWNGWTLEVNHAPPTLTAAKAPFKARGKLALTATCNANCTVTTGGAAKPTTAKLAQDSPGVIVANPTKKTKKKGKGTVQLTATDETGGTATASLKVKVGK